MARLNVNNNSPVPAGTYKLQFERISSRDDEGKPTTKSTDTGPKVYFELLVADGEHAGETVPASTDLDGGLKSWCLMLSGSPPKSRNLTEIEQQIKAAKKVVEMAVNDSGWCRGPVVAKGTHMARFARFTRRENGKPVLVDAEYNNKPYKKVFWAFDIVLGDSAGVQVPASCAYAVNQKGANLEISGKSNMFAWCTACGIDFESLPDFADSSNVLPELEQIMLKKGQVVVVQVGDNGWVTSGAGAVVAAPAGIQAPPKKEEISGSDKLGDLFLFIRKIADQHKLGEMFDKDGAMTDKAKAFARDHIAPICDKLGIPRKFKAMTDPQIEAVMKELSEKFDPSGEKAFMGSTFDDSDLPF